MKDEEFLKKLRAKIIQKGIELRELIRLENELVAESKVEVKPEKKSKK